MKKRSAPVQLLDRGTKNQPTKESACQNLYSSRYSPCLAPLANMKRSAQPAQRSPARSLLAFQNELMLEFAGYFPNNRSLNALSRSHKPLPFQNCGQDTLLPQ